jgi:hypothetical protein
MRVLAEKKLSIELSPQIETRIDESSNQPGPQAIQVIRHAAGQFEGRIRTGVGCHEVSGRVKNHFSVTREAATRFRMRTRHGTIRAAVCKARGKVAINDWRNTKVFL